MEIKTFYSKKEGVRVVLFFSIAITTRVCLVFTPLDKSNTVKLFVKAVMGK